MGQQLVRKISGERERESSSETLINQPGKDSNQIREPSLGEAAQDCKPLGDTNLESEQALQLASFQPPLVEMMEQKESAWKNKLPKRAKVLE